MKRSQPAISQADRLTDEAVALTRQSSHPRQAENLQYRAMDLLSHALEHDPDHPRALALLARLNYERARFDKARQLAQKALSFSSRQVEALRVLARLAFLQRDWRMARHYGARALRYAAPQQWGGVLGQLSRIDGAQAQAKETRVLGAPTRLRLSLSAWVLAILAMAAATLSWGRIARELPGVWGPLAIGGWRALQARLRRDDRAELREWAALVERFPGMVGLQIRLADAYVGCDQLAEAETWYRRALKRDPLCALACDRLATLFEAAEELEDAAALLEHLLAIAPARVDAYRRLGDLSAAAGDLEQASAQYQTYLRVCQNPRDRALQAVNLANLYHDLMDNAPAAQQALLIAIEAEPRCVDHYLQLGAYYYEAGQFADAERVYASALSLAPDNIQALACLGYFKWQTDEIDAAVEYYARAIQRDPNYDIAYNNLGVIYLDHLGRIRDAIALFERATALNPGYALAFYNLGRAHRFLDERDRAVRCFERARSVNAVTGELDGSQLDTLIHALSQAGD